MPLLWDIVDQLDLLQVIEGYSWNAPTNIIDCMRMPKAPLQI